MTFNKIEVACLRQRLAEKALSRAVAETISAGQAAPTDDAVDVSDSPLVVREIARADGIIANGAGILSADDHDERQPLAVMSLSLSEVKHYTPRADGDLCVMLEPTAIAAARVVSFYEAAGLVVALQPAEPYRDAPTISRNGLYSIVVVCKA